MNRNSQTLSFLKDSRYPRTSVYKTYLDPFDGHDVHASSIYIDFNPSRHKKRVNENLVGRLISFFVGGIVPPILRAYI